MKINTPVKGWLNPRLWCEQIWARFGRVWVSEEEAAKRITLLFLNESEEDLLPAVGSYRFFEFSEESTEKGHHNVCHQLFNGLGLGTDCLQEGVAMSRKTKNGLLVAGRAFSRAVALQWVKQSDTWLDHYCLTSEGLTVAEDYRIWCKRWWPKRLADWFEDHKGLMAAAAALFAAGSLYILFHRFVFSADTSNSALKQLLEEAVKSCLSG